MKNLLFPIALLIIISGCKRVEPLPAKNKDTTSTDTSSKLLVSKVIMYYPPNTPANKNTIPLTLTVAYQYDVLKRMTQRIVITSFPEGVSQFISIDTVNYVYDGQNNMTKLTTKHRHALYGPDTAIIDSDVTKYTYVNGQPSYATDIYGNQICTYIVQNGKVATINGLVAYPDQITYINNNILTISEPPAGPPNLPFSCIYGNKNSPYKNSRFKWFLGVDDVLNYYMEFDENDLIGYSGYDVNASVVFKNTYNDAGYPTSIIMTDPSSNITTSETFTYIKAE